jgi:hypothetical protein
MGYAHYWTLQAGTSDALLAAAARDMAKIAEAAIADGIELADASGEAGTSPRLDGSSFEFNGVQPEDDGDSFIWPYGWMGADAEADGSFEMGCKTQGRPYDVAVTACLLVAKHHLGSGIEISSDGGPDEWRAGRALFKRVMGVKPPRVDHLTRIEDSIDPRLLQPFPEPVTLHCPFCGAAFVYRTPWETLALGDHVEKAHPAFHRGTGDPMFVVCWICGEDVPTTSWTESWEDIAGHVREHHPDRTRDLRSPRDVAFRTSG